MRIARYVAAVLFAAGSTVVTVAPAQASPTVLSVSYGNDLYQIEYDDGNIDTKQQKQIVTVSIDDAAIGYVTSYAVDVHHQPSLDIACPQTLAEDAHPLLVGPVHASDGRVIKSQTLPLGIYVYCFYDDRTGTGTRDAARLAQPTLGGSYDPGYHPGNGKLTAINLFTQRTGHTYYVDGAIYGPKTGTVKIQRKGATGWTTLTTVHLVKGVYHAVLAVHRGQKLRAFYVGDKTWRQSWSKTVTVR